MTGNARVAVRPCPPPTNSGGGHDHGTTASARGRSGLRTGQPVVPAAVSRFTALVVPAAPGWVMSV
ncbi:hypothetical protein, partial [Kitasatospora indigofera]|uniref:hypothetical protein n=1 Tax=Kitasatospora indigofera TaxID=67307 RepID=UPI0036387B50